MNISKNLSKQYVQIDYISRLIKQRERRSILYIYIINFLNMKVIWLQNVMNKYFEIWNIKHFNLFI